MAAAGAVNIELCDVADPTIISLWKRIYGFLDTEDVLSGMQVCAAFCKELPSLVTELTISDEDFGQQQLAYLARTFTGLTRLDLTQEYADNAPVLDFSCLHLPSLQSLYLDCKRLRSCCFTEHNTPRLECLTIMNGSAFDSFDLELYELKRVHIEHTQVEDSSNFGDSLSSCPKLHSFVSYKLWGLSGYIHDLHLPECTSLELSRSDDLEGLNLWAPKLKELGLRACYSLDHVRIMDNPPGTTPVPLTVNVIHANIDRVSRQHLKQHPRVKAGHYWTKESQEWAGVIGELHAAAGAGDVPGLDQRLVESLAEIDISAYEDFEDGDLESDLHSDDDLGMYGMEGLMGMLHGGFMGQGPNFMMPEDADPVEQAALMQLMAALAGGMGMYADEEEDDDEHDYDGEEDEDEYEDASDWEEAGSDEPELQQAAEASQQHAGTSLQPAAVATAAAGPEDSPSSAGATGSGDSQRMPPAGSRPRQRGAAAHEPSCVIEELP